MTEQELVELIQGSLPEEFTAGQIEELRAALRHSPAIREALLRELALEQALAERFAPSVRDARAVVHQIERRLAEQRKARWAFTVLIALGVAAALGVSGYWAAKWFTASRSVRQQTGLPVAAPGAGGQHAPDVAMAPSPPTSPTKPEPSTPGESELGAPPPAQEAPGKEDSTPDARKPAAPAADAKLQDWVLFWDPAEREDYSWQKDLKELLGPAPAVDQRAKSVRLNGVHQLRKLPTERSMLRFCVRGEFRTEFWTGQQGARLVLDRHGDLHGYVLSREQGKPPACLAASHEAAWTLLPRGPVDLRWQDGEIVLARGDVLLLRVPLKEPPAEGRLESNGTLRLLQALDCRPLPAPPRPGHIVLDTRRPAELEWRTRATGGAAIQRREDGSLRLSAEQPDASAAAEYSADIAAGVEIEFQVSGATAGSCIGWSEGEGRSARGMHVLESRRGRLFAETSDEREAARAEEAGLFVPGVFWVRLTCGLSGWQLHVGPDGSHYGRFGKWTGYPSEAVQKFRLGVLLAPRQGHREISITQVRLRRLDALQRFAQPDLIARVPATDHLPRDGNWALAAASAFAAARPAGTDPGQWALACNIALLARAVPLQQRLAAAAGVVSSVLAEPARVELSAETLREAAIIGAQDDPEHRVRCYDSLAATCVAAGRSDFLGLLLADAVATPGSSAGKREDAGFFPPGLLRRRLLDLAQRRQWRELRLESARFVYLMRDEQGELRSPRDRHDLLRLALWARAEANSALEEKERDPSAPPPVEWTHPLLPQSQRQAMNVVGELHAALRAGDAGHAAEILARQPLQDGILAVSSDGDLFESAYTHVKGLLRRAPELVAALDRRFASLGMFRLRTAEAAGDTKALEGLAVQFWGTEPGFHAALLLADRDLSTGDFCSAVARYRMLLERSPPEQRQTLAAKLRLASALLGEPEGKPITDQVALPGGTLPAAQFERLVNQAAGAHKAPGGWKLEDQARPAPGKGPLQFARLAELPAGAGDNRPPSRQASLVLDGRNLLASFRGRLHSVDGQSGQVLWSQDLAGRSRKYWPSGPDVPVVASGRIFVRGASGSTEGLLCLDGQSGKVLWRQSYDGPVLAGPVLAASWLYVVTARASLGDWEVCLRRISPQTGESRMAERVARLRDDQRQPAIGTPVQAGDKLIIPLGASVVCCTLEGEVCWLRRLLYVPPDVDASLVAEPRSFEPLVLDGDILVNCPSTPGLTRIKVATGERVWSYLQPDLRAVIGKAGAHVLVASQRYLEALDPATGAAAWRRPFAVGAAAAIPAEADSVLTALLERVDPRKSQDMRGLREFAWLSAADGREIYCQPLPPADFHSVQALISDGQQVFGIATGGVRSTAQLFVLRP